MPSSLEILAGCRHRLVKWRVLTVVKFSLTNKTIISEVTKCSFKSIDHFEHPKKMNDSEQHFLDTLDYFTETS